MRYIQIINSVSGGGAQVLAVSLHRAWIKDGRDAILIALSGDKIEDLEHVIVVGSGSPYGFVSCYNLFLVLRRLRLTKQDILHVHLFPAQLYVAIWRRFTRGQFGLFTTEHSTYNRRRKSRLCRVLDRWIYKRFDAVICISKAARTSLGEWLGCYRSLHVVYNGINLESYTGVKREAKCRSPGNPFKITSIGSLTEIKNHAFMLEILSRCKTANWHLRIAGDGPLRNVLETRVKELGLRKQVSFLGFIDGIPEILAASDLFLHLPRWEGFGLVVVEAMASGCPVVAGDVDGLNEVIRPEHKEGILVKYEDREALIELLEKIINRETPLDDYCKAGELRAQDFSFDRMKDQYVNIYNEKYSNQK